MFVWVEIRLSFVYDVWTRVGVIAWATVAQAQTIMMPHYNNSVASTSNKI